MKLDCLTYLKGLTRLKPLPITNCFKLHPDFKFEKKQQVGRSFIRTNKTGPLISNSDQ